MKSVFPSSHCHKLVGCVLFLFLVFLTLTKEEESKEYAEKNIERKIVYTKRLMKIHKVCRKYGLLASQEGKVAVTKSKIIQLSPLTDIPPFYDKAFIMYLEKYSLLYCWINKAASSSWNRIFFELSNMMVPEDLSLASNIFRPSQNESLQELAENSTVSFAFVRHPFERLVSVYRDKFELASETQRGEFFFKYYATQILDLPESAVTSGEIIPRPSFPQFVSYLLDITELDYNSHWLPFWLNCQFCKNKFNVIGKFETMKEDIEYIINASNINIRSSRFPRVNSHSSQSKDHKLLSLRYFRDIGEESVKRLYDIYKIDFEMFGYSVNEYLL